VSVVPRISTGIQNPAIGQSDLYSTSGSRAARAGANFMRGVKELQYRFLNATNWKCKTAPPRGSLGPAEFREQDFLRKLSKGKMDPLDTMLGLVRLTDVKPNAFAQLKVTRHQAQRMLDNLEAHGELFSVLQAHIRSPYSELIDRGPVHLKFLNQLNGNFERLAKQLMDRARYSGETLAVDVDDCREPQLNWVMNKTWMALHKSVTAAPGEIFQQELLRAKDERRELSGTKAQKEFVLDLKEAREVFKEYNVIPPEPLRNMLTRALRKVGVDAPDRIVQKNVHLLTEAPTHRHAKLLPPLLEAMSDVIDGVGSARYDLKRAMQEIAKAAKDPSDRSPDVMALDLINEHYENHYTYGRDLNDVRRDLSEIEDESLRNFARFIVRYPWVPGFFSTLAEIKPSAKPLSAIMEQLCVTAAERLDWQIPTELFDNQEEDFKRFLSDFRGGDSWHEIYRFFGVPDESES
jgi:hypothetical protein